MNSALAHPTAFARASAQTVAVAAIDTSTSPARSIVRSGPNVSSTTTWTTRIATSATGTLIQKIHCHGNQCETAPPTTGPAITASPVTPSRTPIAVPRRLGGNTDVTIVRPIGRMIAPPTPCRARHAINMPTPEANAAPAEPSANTASPIDIVRRRPNRSPSAAPVNNSAAKLTPYAVTIHCSDAVDVPRSRRIVSSDVVTTSRSSATMNDAADAAASTQPRRVRRLRDSSIAGAESISSAVMSVRPLVGSRDRQPR